MLLILQELLLYSYSSLLTFGLVELVFVAANYTHCCFVAEEFLPVKKGRRTRLVELSAEQRSIVLYESPHRMLRTLQDLAQAMGAERLASASRELSKVHEETVRGSLAELITYFTGHPPRGEFVLVIDGAGHAAP